MLFYLFISVSSYFYHELEYNMVTLGIICIICIIGFIGCGMTSKDGRTQSLKNPPHALVQVGKKMGIY